MTHGGTLKTLSQMHFNDDDHFNSIVIFLDFHSTKQGLYHMHYENGGQGLPHIWGFIILVFHYI